MILVMCVATKKVCIMAHNYRYIAAVAGAGTGKTYSLVENYLEALFGFDGSGIKKRPAEIVALTFTEKAAHEMRLRIIKKLALLSADNGEELCKKALEFGVKPPSHDEIKRIIRAMPNAPIATFHGFCSSFLRKEAHALGMRDDFVIMSPKEELMYAKDILRPIIMNRIERQESLVRSLLARFRLQNGLMSLGLLDNLLDLYFKLPEQGLSVDRLYTMLPSCLEDDGEKIEVALRILAGGSSSLATQQRIKEIDDLWHETKHELMGEDEFAAARAYGALRNAIGGNWGNKEARQQLVSAVVRLGARLVDKFMQSDESEIAHLMLEFHQAFDQFKAQASLLSYADLLLKTRFALLNNLNLRRRIKSTISHLLVDEYQDTSPIQEDLIAMLLEQKGFESRIPAGRRILDTVHINQGSSLFVVGDKKQSIYGFRGADVTLFDQMINKMSQEKTDFSMRLLTINRRSSTRVISLVNLVASVTLREQGYQPEHALEAFHDDRDGHCALWVKKSDGLDKTDTNLACAADGIAHLLSHRSDIFAADIVVLVRRIKSAAAIKSRLNRFGIHARIVGGDGFFQQQEVVDILSALKLLNDPGFELASAVVLRSPLVLLTDQELLDIKIKTGGISLLHAVTALEQGVLSASSAARLKIFSDALKTIRENLVERGLLWAIDTLIEVCQFSYALGLSATPEQKWSNIKKLLIMARSIKNPFIAIEDFYQQIYEDLREPLAEISSSHNAVTIMTIHQSKGLEFKVVVLADGESALPQHRGDIVADNNLGLAIKPKNRPLVRVVPKGADKLLARTRFDQIKDTIQQRELQEIARLLYVAMTRAQHELYVVCSQESLFKKAETQSLVGLFLRAYHQLKDQFEAICDVVLVPDFSGTFKSDKDDSHIDEATMVFSSAYKERIFASALQGDLDVQIPWIRRDFRAPKKQMDGNYAHKLIANLAKAYVCTANVSLKAMLDASARALSIESNQQAQATIDAVAITLDMLKASLPKHADIIVEMPLSCWANRTILVEGFADMVVITSEFVGVVEFKSTLKAAVAPKSYAQVLAYAHALTDQFEKPIKFAVHLVGAPQEIIWHDYDEKAQRVFLDMMTNKR